VLLHYCVVGIEVHHYCRQILESVRSHRDARDSNDNNITLENDMLLSLRYIYTCRGLAYLVDL
jgi:hypothetical protein